MISIKWNRRSFIKIGGLFPFFSQLSLAEEIKSDKSIIWLWLGGGASQFETFHAPKPNINVPSEHQSINGIRYDTNTDICLGGLWMELARHTNKFLTVNSFMHDDPSHKHASHYVMTGHYNPERAETASQKFPSIGSIIATYFGSSTPAGLPVYIANGTIDGDDALWLGAKHKPFDPSAKENLKPRIELDRFTNRFDMLSQLDKKNMAQTNAKAWGDLKQQAYTTILGDAAKAFDTSKETVDIKEKYGETIIGEQLLLTRRLVEAGSKFITIHYGGWDMHEKIEAGLKDRVPSIDKALAALIEDIWQRGLQNKTMIIVTTEFGRTKLNAGAGRDHWPNLVPLLISCGDYAMGRTIGKNDKVYVPTSDIVKPQDLMYTIFDYMSIPKSVQKVDNTGRPRYLLEVGDYNARNFLT